MNDPIRPSQPVICEFCGKSMRYKKLFRHIQQAHQGRPLTKPVAASLVMLQRKRRSKTPHAVNPSVKAPVKHVIAVPIDDLKKCPHGVPEIQTCAICEPDKWRMENEY